MTEVTLPTANKPKGVLVPEADAALIKKVHKILNSGKNVNVEIRRDNSGNPKVFKVSKEIT